MQQKNHYILLLFHHFKFRQDFCLCKKDTFLYFGDKTKNIRDPGSRVSCVFEQEINGGINKQFY